MSTDRRAKAKLVMLAGCYKIYEPSDSLVRLIKRLRIHGPYEKKKKLEPGHF